MTKVCVRTLSLATATATTIFLAMAPAMAQTRLDPPLVAAAPPAVAEPSPLQGVATLRMDVSPPSTASSPGFGPMETSPLPGAHPLQNGGGK